MRRLLILLYLTAAATLGLWVAPPPSDAASQYHWNRVARCESTGRWHIHTGNGYYGGLQISRSTWRAYNGGHFARLPHLATKAEQITVAGRILRHQGRHAWPTCGRYL